MAIEDDILALLVVVDGKVDAIQAKTDQLTFTGGKVDAVTTSGSSVVLGAERFEDFLETSY